MDEMTAYLAYLDVVSAPIFDVREETSQAMLEYAAAVYEELQACADYAVPDGVELAGYPLAAARVADRWMLGS